MRCLCNVWCESSATHMLLCCEGERKKWNLEGRGQAQEVEMKVESSAAERSNPALTQEVCLYFARGIRQTLMRVQTLLAP
eukprot:3977761-Pleurochrysis_carterae.AAC.2